MTQKLQTILKNLPESPGVYLMKNAVGDLLYVGKAGSLKRRVSSYFQKAHDARIEALVSEIADIKFEVTNSALEALVLEANYIKKFNPPFNVKEKDDKSFLFITFTKTKFPKPIIVRGKNRDASETYLGPFLNLNSIKDALKVLRKIFPYCEKAGEAKKLPLPRPCFDYEIHLCSGACVNKISAKDYKKNINHLKLFLSGRVKTLIKNLEKDMKAASAELSFETAEKVKRQIFSITHLQDVSFIKEDELLKTNLPKTGHRIEGYDISNISGQSAVGVMVVFYDNEPDKSSYRKFKIRTVKGPNDFHMLKEVLERRLEHAKDWSLPSLILVDGGLIQVKMMEGVLRDFNLSIPVVGLAKGPERKRNDFLGIIPSFTNELTLIKVRDESHRFAIKYHKELRARNFLK